MEKDLEIPKGKRTSLYRFFEILPGILSYFLVLLLFILSIVSPVLGAVYLLLIISATLVKAVGTAYRTLQGYKIVQKAQKVNWAERLKDLSNPSDAYERLRGTKSESYHFGQHVQNLKLLSSVETENYPDPKDVYHAVIMVAYDESLETLVPSVQAIADTTFDNKKIILVFGYEERGGEQIEECAKKLKEKFGKTFYDFVLVKHPDGLKGEIKGKGPNLTYAGEFLAKYVEEHRIPTEHVIVTSLDSDNQMSETYLDYVAYEFVVNNNRQHMSFQPVSLFMNNIWDAPAPMRIIGVSNSFFNIVSTMRPHVIRNFASHSQPLAALKGMGFWSKRTIVEDGHQYWRSLFYFDGL